MNYSRCPVKLAAKGIKLGYFAQHQLEFLRADESPIQHLARLAPQELEQNCATTSAALDSGDKVSEETRRFSGGEKRAGAGVNRLAAP